MLSETAEIMEEISQCAQRGIIAGPKAAVDMPKAVAHKNGVVKKARTDGVAGLLRSHKIDVYHGAAALASETTLTCGGGDLRLSKRPAVRRLQAHRNPHSRRRRQNVLDSDALLDLETLPKRLAIIGGGVIG